MYLGVEGEYPRFFIDQVSAEIEFVPDASGGYPAMVLRQTGQDMVGERK